MATSTKYMSSDQSHFPKMRSMHVTFGLTEEAQLSVLLLTTIKCKPIVLSTSTAFTSTFNIDWDQRLNVQEASRTSSTLSYMSRTTLTPSVSMLLRFALEVKVAVVGSPKVL